MSKTGIVERLREFAFVSRGNASSREEMGWDGAGPYRRRADMFEEAASLIERQQKAIDLLLRAIEPFAETMSFFLEDGFDDDDIDKILLGSNISPAHLRAARSAKEQAEKLLREGK